jgi:hypothetical protein
MGRGGRAFPRRAHAGLEHDRDIRRKLSFVFVAWLGAPETGFFGNWTDRMAVFESAGCMLAVFALAAGLVLGESVIAAVWIMVVLDTGVPGIFVLPN